MRSGEVTSVELHDGTGSEDAPGRSAIVSFVSASSLDTALLLSGATIIAGEPPITVTAALVSPAAAAAAAAAAASPGGAVGYRVRGAGDDDDLIDFQRVQDVMATLMAKGFVLGKDALAKAKARRNRARSNAALGAALQRSALTRGRGVRARRRWMSRRA